jgi:sugar lactone lactonase YvrE
MSTKKLVLPIFKMMLVLTFTMFVAMAVVRVAPVAHARGSTGWTNGQAASVVLGEPNFACAGASASSMNNPYGVAVDPTTGKVFVSDIGNNRILRFSSAGAAISGSAAEAVLGQADFCSTLANRGGSVAANTLDTQIGVSVDPSGRLWVADQSNNRVLRFDNASSKTNGANADGVLGQADFVSNAVNRGGAVAADTLNNPGGVYADASGHLWVGDVNNRVLRFNNAAAKNNGDPADGVLGQALFTTNAGATTQNGMKTAVAVVVDGSGSLFVADYPNNRVLRFDNAAAKANGANADGVLGQILFTTSVTATTQSGMNSPRGVAIDNTGRLYVSDTMNNRILIFNNATARANGDPADNVLGQTDFTTGTANTGGISASTLNAPRHVFFDNPANVLYVGDLSNHRALRYSFSSGWTNGQSANVVLGQTVFTSNGVNTTNAAMYLPYGVAVDPTTGKVFVSDLGNNRILRFSSAGAAISGSAAEAVLGQADFVSASANRGGTVAANTMNVPVGVSVDPSGRLWVVDQSNNRVLRFDNASSKTNGANADGVLGQADFVSSAANRGGSVAANTMNVPGGVYADASGNLWVADQTNNRVLRFNNAAAKNNGDPADGVLGQALFTTRTGATTQSGMRTVLGVVDGSGSLFVADTSNNRVLRFDNAAAKANGANADGVLGQILFTTSVTATTQSGMNSPRGVAIDNTGRLYVSDTMNNRILIFNNATARANGDPADNVLGQTDFTTGTANTGGISASTLNAPRHVFFDDTANVLWVGDRVNHRVLRYGGYALYLPVILR